MTPGGDRGAPRTALQPATPADRDRILAWLRDFYRGAGYPLDEPAAAAALEGLLRDPAVGRAWLVLVEGRPAGYAVVTFGWSLEYRGRDAFVDELFLEPAVRGRGVGEAVLAAVEAACAELGVRALHLEVERDNARGQALYRKRGFRDGGRQLLTKRLTGAAGS
jgi:GNAT superfamily N-acetyltransferase